MKNQPVQSINTMLRETSQPESKVVPSNRMPDTGGSLDTGQPPQQQQQQQASTETEQVNEMNSMGYSFNLSNRLMLENDMDDIDSTDDMDDMDDHHQAMGDGSYNANLTGLANNAAMFIEDDKRKRRAIANSNERRRMQSINAGFQTLKSLIPHSSGEKLSKACILQRSADFMQFLSNEKDKLSTKLTAAFKILESNGLMDQLNEKASSDMRSGATTTSASFTSTSSKPSATTKINKQYVSAYNSTPAAAPPQPTTTTTTTTATASTSLLSSALADCTNDLKTTQPESTQDNRNSAKPKPTLISSSTTSTTGTVMPIKSLTTTIARTQLQPTSSSDPDSSASKLTSESSNSTQQQQPTVITPIQLGTPIQCTNPTEINLLLNNSGLTRLISTNNTESSLILSDSVPSNLEVTPITSDIPNLLVPSIESQLVSPPMNVQCIQIDLNNPTEESTRTDTSSTGKPSKTKVTTNDLVALLNGIKDTNPNIDISSVTNLILKSIISSNKLDNINLLDPEIQAGLAELSKKQNIQLNVEINNQQTDLNVLLSSLQQQPQAITNTSKVSAESLTNNHLKNASILASKSSRSNSIDQLIAAAAVTAHGSTCMSPLSPSNSPTGSSNKTNDASQATDEAVANELTVSRKNLNTIVEAIFHVEGASRMDELVDYTEIAKQQQQRYQNSLPSSSYTASSSCMSTTTQQKEETVVQQQQQKPPKKRKYTTEDITQTQEDPQHSTQTQAKQSHQFISEYYNNNSSSGQVIEQCQSNNRILAKSRPASSSSGGSTSNKTPKKSNISTSASGSGSSSSDENISSMGEQKKSSSNLVGLLITS